MRFRKKKSSFFPKENKKKKSTETKRLTKEVRLLGPNSRLRGHEQQWSIRIFQKRRIEQKKYIYTPSNICFVFLVKVIEGCAKIQRISLFQHCSFSVGEWNNFFYNHLIWWKYGIVSARMEMDCKLIDIWYRKNALSLLFFFFSRNLSRTKSMNATL